MALVGLRTHDHIAIRILQEGNGQSWNVYTYLTSPELYIRNLGLSICGVTHRYRLDQKPALIVIPAATGTVNATTSMASRHQAINFDNQGFINYQMRDLQQILERDLAGMLRWSIWLLSSRSTHISTGPPVWWQNEAKIKYKVENRTVHPEHIRRVHT